MIARPVTVEVHDIAEPASVVDAKGDTILVVMDAHKAREVAACINAAGDLSVDELEALGRSPTYARDALRGFALTQLRYEALTGMHDTVIGGGK